MKIGISSWACPWQIGVQGYPKPIPAMNWQALLDLAVIEHAEVLQIADNLPLHSLPPTEWAALGTAAGSAGIVLEIGTRGLDPEHIRQYVDIAKHARANMIRTLPHDGQDRPDFGEALYRLRIILPMLERENLVLAIENHDHYPAGWLRDLVIAASNTHVRVCLDGVNNLGQGESFREVLSALGDLTVSFHCKDYTIRRKSTQLGFDVEGCTAGAGFLDLKLAARVLPAACSWVIESWLPWQGDITKTCEMERQWLHTGLHNLRAFRDGMMA